MNEIEIPILYEDGDTLIVDKPCGLLSEDSEREPSVVRLLLSDGGRSFLSPVTRLDREVAGVMLLAKNPKSAAYYSTKMAAREEIQKTYLAVASGKLSEPRGEMHDLLFKDTSRNKSFVVKRMRRGVKEASLSYAVVGEREEEGDVLSLVLIRLHTGRTHQIRVQLSSRRHPLVGDRKYGGDASYPMGLLSYRLTVRTPKGKTLTLTSTRAEEAPFALFAEEVARLAEDESNFSALL